MKRLTSISMTSTISIIILLGASTKSNYYQIHKIRFLETQSPGSKCHPAMIGR